MSPEADDIPQPTSEADEKQLCMRCLAPNEPSAHFCIKCGTPLSSYASTGPFESVFAEGAVYREAAERPRSLIVVVGVWVIFGMIALTGLAMVLVPQDNGIGYRAFGAGMLGISVVLIGKSTRNYLRRPKPDEKHD